VPSLRTRYLVIICRYDTAVERKSMILDIIRALDLPNNPLDDIIDQVINFLILDYE
jgi:hypothetical protein